MSGMGIATRVAWVAICLSSIEAWADRALSRATTLPIQTCERTREARFRRSNELLQRTTDRLTSASAGVFMGDLAPANICVRVDPDSSDRAFARVDSRAIDVGPGLILRTQNESQLGWVLAHELAHITLRHEPLDGTPLTGTDADDARRRLHRMFDLRDAVFGGKGASNARERAEYDRLGGEVIALMQRRIGPDAAANWTEVEADEIALWFYLRAGFDPAEINWRSEQLAISDARGLDPHSPPLAQSAAERTAEAERVCGITATSPAPRRGVHRYAEACWSVWNSRREQFRRYPELSGLGSRGPAMAPAGGPTLAQVQTELRGARCDVACGSGFSSVASGGSN